MQIFYILKYGLNESSFSFLVNGVSQKLASSHLKLTSNQETEKTMTPHCLSPQLPRLCSGFSFVGMDPSCLKVSTICGQHNKLNHIG